MPDKRYKAVIIDGHSLLYRAFYALPSFSNSQGEATSAIYGFLNMLLKLINDQKPHYIGVSFDLPQPTFRHKIFKEYKSIRQKMPESLTPQINRLKEILPLLGVSFWEVAGFEGDDIMGTISQKLSKEHIPTLIVTADNDLLQLVTEDINVMKNIKGVSHFKIYTPEKVKEELGVYPQRIPDFKAIVGDKSDNIPGVPGIGKKTALKLLQRFSCIEDIYENINEIKDEKLRKKLEENKEVVLKNKEIIRIKTDVDLSTSLEELTLKPINAEKLLPILQELELYSLIKRLNIQKNKAPSSAEPHINHTEEVIEEAKKSRTLAIKNAGKLIHLSSETKNCIISPKELESIKEICEDDNIKKYGNNIKKEYLYLSKHNIKLKGIHFDTAVASYLLNPSRKAHSVENINLYLFGKSNASNVITRDILESVPQLREKLESYSLITLFNEIEIPLISILAEMEITGIKVDIKMLQDIKKDIEDKIREKNDYIRERIGTELNLNSPKQLSHLLFDVLHLPPIKKTKTGFSTDFETLHTLYQVTGSDLLKQIIEYRQLTKILNSYIIPLLELVDKNTHKIHTSFNQMVTSTGRLSSSNPNLQNIPLYSEFGKELRKAFVVSSSENIFLSADYSQIELRILAHFSKDELLMKAFSEGIDIHSLTAQQIFGVKMQNITSDMRRKAKAINFGIIYGMSDYGLAKSVGISRKESKKYIENYFNRYPKVKEFIENTIKEARESGMVKTLLGRIRMIPEINSRNKTVQKEGERLAINTPIQGSAADLIKMAMVKSMNFIKESNLHARLLLQIHDELLFELPEHELEEFEEKVKHTMEHAIELEVPLKVNIATGKNWGELDK